MSSPQMSFHVIYKAPCGLCLRNMAEIQHYLFQTRCDFIFLEMFCLDPYVLVDRPFQPQKPFYYIPDITGGKEDIPLSCVNEIDSTPPPKVAYSKDCMGMVTMERLTGVLCWVQTHTHCYFKYRDDGRVTLTGFTLFVMSHVMILLSPRQGKERIPEDGVFINTSADFLVGCDCTDGCRDKLVKCPPPHNPPFVFLALP